MAEGFVRGASETGDPLLLTPGPLTTSRSVKAAMLHDWGSRDANFLSLNGQVLGRLPEVINAAGTHVTVPVQGSGTFAVEAMIGTTMTVRTRAAVSRPCPAPTGPRSQGNTPPSRATVG